MKGNPHGIENCSIVPCAIDEMIDESRADGIDNDGDWNPLQNDTGLDGVPFIV